MIKIIAILSMVIDHVGFFFFPEVPFFRYIGRLAIPLFSWLLVQGHGHSKNIDRYLLNLIVFALITQPVYAQLFPNNLTPNFLFTLFWGLLLVHIFDNHSKWAFILIFPLLHFHMVNIDILWIIFFYFTRTMKFNVYLSTLPRISQGKYLFYCFYPIHFLIIYTIQ